MKAVYCKGYGTPDVLELRDVDKPAPESGRVVVQVHAASLNVADYYDLRGGVGRLSGGLLRPKDPRVGRDFAGLVEAIGEGVAHINPGDEVFGTCPGSFAEYASAREDRIALKPANVSFEEASAIPVAGLTALQGLRDAGHIKPGQKVLIDGASGGVGTFAVQIAKAFGGEVTAVCSPRNQEIARSIGADHVIDYTQADYTQNQPKYDLILGVNGDHSIFSVRRALSPTGVYVMAGASRRSVLLMFMQVALFSRLLSKSGGQKLGFMGITKVNQADLAFVGELVEERKVVPVIAKRYPLGETAQAFRYLGEGHAMGKVIINIKSD